MTTRSPANRRRPPVRPYSPWRGYVEQTRRPLACLLFLFPLVATYEFGTLLLGPTGVWTQRPLVAHSMIQDLLAWFGVRGFWLPALVLVLTLLIWHILLREPWRVRAWLLPAMAIESIVLTAPLFVLGRVMAQAATAPVVAADARAHVVLALGAGIYEELVFRLGLVVGLMWVFESGFRASRTLAGAAAVILSAAVFAGCHFQPVGAAPFSWPRYLHLAAAGAYLAVVFLLRGLGIAAGCHAAFNLLLAWSLVSTTP